MVFGFVLWVLAVAGRDYLFAFDDFVDDEGAGFEGVWVFGAGGCEAEVVTVWEMDLYLISKQFSVYKSSENVLCES